MFLVAVVVVVEKYRRCRTVGRIETREQVAIRTGDLNSSLSFPLHPSPSPSPTMLPGGMRTRKESSASVATQTTSPTIANARARAKSPTFSTTTAASDMPFASEVVITRANLRDSIRAYEDVSDVPSEVPGYLIELSVSRSSSPPCRHIAAHCPLSPMHRPHWRERWRHVRG